MGDRGCLSYSGIQTGYCLGGYDIQANDKHPIRLIFIGFFLFRLVKTCHILGCPQGVLKVSGKCLEGVLHTQDYVWGI